MGIVAKIIEVVVLLTGRTSGPFFLIARAGLVVHNAVFVLANLSLPAILFEELQELAILVRQIDT